jgi:hypothetical protein
LTGEIFIKNILRGIPQSSPTLAIGEQSNPAENFAPSYGSGKQRGARLVREPGQDGGFGYRLQYFRKHVP